MLVASVHNGVEQMPENMPTAYEGNLEYIFVDYAHADRDAALPMIAALADEGYRVWYDDGIELATEYPEYIAKHVLRCASFVMLVSRASLASEWCRSEVNYALDLKKERILPIYLEDVELTPGLQMRMGNRQALFWHEYDSDEAFYRKLFRAKRLDCCLTEEGRRRRGVKPKVKKEETATEHEVVAVREPPSDAVASVEAKGRSAVPDPEASIQEVRAVREASRIRELVNGSGGVEGVEPKGSLADYSWAELKEISRAIAAAGEDEWEGIAKKYRLVDADGILRGAEKGFELVGGTKASVRILGFRHDELADGSVAGISFEFAGVPAMHRMNPTDTNAGGWKGSEMRRWLNDEGGFLALLPGGLRRHVAMAKKRTNNRGRVPENDTSAVKETNDALWLLSMSEVYGRLSEQSDNVPWSPETYDVEGMQYQFYRDKGVSTTNYKHCQKRGADSWWWLRSPNANGSNGFHYVDPGGVWFYWSYASNDDGVSPGFCF